MFDNFIMKRSQFHRWTYYRSLVEGLLQPIPLEQWKNGAARLAEKEPSRTMAETYCAGITMGPTASGKTDLAIEIARQCNGEIINADAMQVFQGLDIATNKPTTEERRGVEHHLLASVPSTALITGEDSGKHRKEMYTVQDYQKGARKLITEINARNKLPILVGGTNYYIQAVILKDFLIRHETDRNAELEEGDLHAGGSTSLDTQEAYEKLKRVDPRAADKIHPNDLRKINRALQVYEKSRLTMSDAIEQQGSNVVSCGDRGGWHADEDHQSVKQRHELLYQCVFIFLDCDRTVLNERINRRALQMVQKGLLDEIDEFRKQVKDAGNYSVEILQTIGFKEFVPYFETLDRIREASPKERENMKDELENVRDRCIESLQTVTRRYARKQLSWYKNKWAAIGSPLFSPGCGLSCLYCMDITESISDGTKRQRLIDDAVAIAKTVVNPADTDEQSQARLKDKYLVQQPLATLASSIDESQLWKKYWCEKCERELNGWKEWTAHLASRMHRKMKRKKQTPSTNAPDNKKQKENHIDTDKGNA